MSVTKNVVGLSIGAILIATLGVSAITTLEAVNTTTWGTDVVAVFGILAIIVVIAFALLILSYADVI